MTGQRGLAGPLLVISAAVVVLVLAGIGVELWRVVAEHRRLTGLVEGAALSGAAALDTEWLYAGVEQLRLDPVLATDRACDYVRRHGDLICGAGVDVVVEGASIDVEAHRRLELTLLRLVAPGGSESIEVVARASAGPVRSG